MQAFHINILIEVKFHLEKKSPFRWFHVDVLNVQCVIFYILSNIVRIIFNIYYDTV